MVYTKPLSVLLGVFALIYSKAGWALSGAEIQSSVNSFFLSFNQAYGKILFWSDHPLKLPLILIVMVSGGLFCTLRFKLVNVALFKHAVDVLRGKFDKEGHKGEITHFQALTSALSATVGLGNIAGVALAISMGGPGAVFWLWVIAFFGMSMKFASCTLAQLYRNVYADGTVLGGPMVYLSKGIKEHYPRFGVVGKAFSVMFAVFAIAASFGGGNLFQGNQTFELLANQFPVLANYSWFVGLILAFFIGIVIIGGIKRIGEVTSKMVPAMCFAYCAGCLIIIFGEIGKVPSLLFSIFQQAFDPEAMWAGGFIGVLTVGVRRASFSNESGLGSAAIAHAAAKTDRPIREGVVAMIGPFIDTHLVCTMTALAILITGAHLDPSLSGKGAAITAKAFSNLGSWTPYFLTIASVIFAYSTAISWSYYGEKGTHYLFGKKYINYYRVVYVFIASLGPVLSISNVIDFSDLMLLSMAFPNIMGLILLSGKLGPLLKKYREDYKSGKMIEVS